MDMGDYLKKIANGMFGKQQPYHLTQQEEPPEVRPVIMILEDLAAFGDADWAKYAFSREPLNGKFTDVMRVELTQKALACGRAEAQKCMEKYNTDNPNILAEKLGLRVEYPDKPQSLARVLFAEFEDPDRIFIYMDGVQRGRDLLADTCVGTLLGNPKLTEVLLAHEIFHYVEQQNKNEIWTKNYRMDMSIAKIFRQRVGVAVLSEIAAMGFAGYLTSLPYLPYVMDAFLVYGYSPQAASALYEEMMKLAGKEPRLATEDGKGGKVE